MSEFYEPEESAEAGVGLEPGKVYFMREVDLRTGESFPYYKIGKVLDAKDVAKRLKEHQTGNPRVIETVTEIESPIVTRLETMLHNIFANERIHSGEWFAFGTDVELSRAIERANQLNADLQANSSTVAAAKELESQNSNGAKKAPSSSDTDLIEMLASYRDADKVVTGLSKAVKEHIKTFTSLPGFQTFGQIFEAAAPAKFSSVNFKKAEPALYSDYQTKPSFSKKFIPSPRVKGSAKVLTEEMTGIAAVSGELARLNLVEAHLEYLRLWGLAAELDWQIANLLAQAKVATGDYDGLEGLTTWKRYNTFVFDSARLKVEQPAVYAQFMGESTTREVFKVFEWRSY